MAEVRKRTGFHARGTPCGLCIHRPKRGEVVEQCGAGVSLKTVGEMAAFTGQVLCSGKERRVVPKIVHWKLDDGVSFVRKLEESLEPFGLHVALGGSVLMAVASYKDLDIFVYPHDVRADWDVGQFRDALRALEYFKLSVTVQQIHAHWKKGDDPDISNLRGSKKLVEVWRYGVRRVDVFYLYCKRPHMGIEEEIE